MSISLSAFSINTRSPYPVRTENGYSFLFTTDYGHIYEIGFLEDFTLGDNCNTYQFFISLHDNNHYPRDKKGDGEGEIPGTSPRMTAGCLRSPIRSGMTKGGRG